jgi:hypothetical protein
MLLAIRPSYAEFAPLLPMSRDPVLAYVGISKFELFRSLLEPTQNDDGGTVADNLPPLLLAKNTDPIPEPAALAALGLPLYIKSDAVHARENCSGGFVERATTTDLAQRLLRRRLTTHDRVTIQGAAPGVGTGAFISRWNDKVLARFMHLRLHELPVSGCSSYRTSWWHPSIIADAEAKLAHLGWNGVAMMEYRWDPATDRFFLLEMNARFWGSLHLALYAGVDFPCLLIDAFHGRNVEAVNNPVPTVRCRNLTIELRYLWSRLRAGDTSVAQRLWAVLEFVLLSLHPGIKSDLWYPGDRRVWWLQFRQYLSSTLVRERDR